MDAAEKLLDRCLLKLYAAALKANRLPRALDTAGRLSLSQSLEGALKLANHYRWACRLAGGECGFGLCLHA